mmetsp:Transcript_103561/g.309396  ORF Transcript_103561/g.309396 Transcript_103561/m.309396 type:complete len:365 (-) Transcript_103561:73-1167(-)
MRRRPGPALVGAPTVPRRAHVVAFLRVRRRLLLLLLPLHLQLRLLRWQMQLPLLLHLLHLPQLRLPVVAVRERGRRALLHPRRACAVDLLELVVHCRQGRLIFPQVHGSFGLLHLWHHEQPEQPYDAHADEENEEHPRPPWPGRERHPALVDLQVLAWEPQGDDAARQRRVLLIPVPQGYLLAETHVAAGGDAALVKAPHALERQAGPGVHRARVPREIHVDDHAVHSFHSGPVAQVGEGSRVLPGDFARASEVRTDALGTVLLILDATHGQQAQRRVRLGIVHGRGRLRLLEGLAEGIAGGWLRPSGRNQASAQLPGSGGGVAGRCAAEVCVSRDALECQPCPVLQERLDARCFPEVEEVRDA